MKHRHSRYVDSESTRFLDHVAGREALSDPGALGRGAATV